MAWPFSTPRVWDFDTGFVDIPASTTSLSTAVLYLAAASFCNTTDTALTVTLLDSTGGNIINAQEVPARSIFQPAAFNFMPVTGLKWAASATGVTGKIWGWQ